METTAMLAAFGLTSQETKIYIALHGCDTATGYELARLAGISRSNAYAALSGLAEKGAAEVIDGKPVRYRAVPTGEFCGTILRRLHGYEEQLRQRLVLVDEADSQYITLRGSQRIREKIAAILAEVRHRVYLAMPSAHLAQFADQLRELVRTGIKVVIVSDDRVGIDGALFYRSPGDGDGIRIIADSTYCLTGDVDGGPDCTSLFSTKKNLAALLKHSIKNEIRLIELTHSHSEGNP